MMLTRVATTRHLCLETDLLKYQYCTIYREKMKNVLKICYCVALRPQKLIINPSFLTHNSFALNIELLSTRKLFKMSLFSLLSLITKSMHFIIFLGAYKSNILKRNISVCINSHLMMLFSTRLFFK